MNAGRLKTGGTRAFDETSLVRVLPPQDGAAKRESESPGIAE
jgi:hypothetical protein